MSRTKTLCRAPFSAVLEWKFRQGMAGMSHDLGRDVPGSEKLYASKLCREGVNREKLTVKKIISITRCFFSPLMSLINREKLCVNREKSAPKIHHIFSPLVFHRLRPHDFGLIFRSLFCVLCLSVVFSILSGKILVWMVMVLASWVCCASGTFRQIRNLQAKKRGIFRQNQSSRVRAVISRHLLNFKGLRMNHMLPRGSAERIWGKLFDLVRRIYRKSPANFSANFSSDSFPQFVRPCFSRVSGPPNFIDAQNRQHSSPISHVWIQTILHADFLLIGETTIWTPECQGGGVTSRPQKGDPGPVFSGRSENSATLLSNPLPSQQEKIHAHSCIFRQEKGT